MRLAAVLLPAPVRLSCPSMMVAPPWSTPVIPPIESLVLVSKDHLLAKVAPCEAIRLTMRSQVNKKNPINRCVGKESAGGVVRR